MNIFVKSINGTLGSFLLVGGLVLSAPILLPAVGRMFRPLAKEVIKGYLALADIVQEAVNEQRESSADLSTSLIAEGGQEIALTAGESLITEIAELVTEGVEEILL